MPTVEPITPLEARRAIESIVASDARALASAIRGRISYVDGAIAVANEHVKLIEMLLGFEPFLERLPPEAAQTFREQVLEHPAWVEQQRFRQEQLRSLLRRVESSPPPAEHQCTLMLEVVGQQAAAMDAGVAFMDLLCAIAPRSKRAEFRARRCRVANIRNQWHASWRRFSSARSTRPARRRSRARANRRRRSASSPPPATGDPDPDPEPPEPGANAITRTGCPLVVLDARDRAALTALASELGHAAADLWFDGKAGLP